MRNKLCGIYGLFDKRDNSCLYIGQSVDIAVRTNNHLRKITNKNHDNYKIREWSENNSVNNIEVRILVICSKRQLNDYENKMFNIYKPVLNLEEPKTYYKYIGWVKKERLSIDYNYLYDLYIIQNKSTTDISNTTNYSQRHICSLLNEYNIVKDNKMIQKMKKMSYNDLYKYEYKIIISLNNNIPLKEISVDIDCKIEILRTFIKDNIFIFNNKLLFCKDKNNVISRKRVDNTNKKTANRRQVVTNFFNKDLITDMYVNQHKSIREIAEHYKCSETTISKYVKKHNLFMIDCNRKLPTDKLCRYLCATCGVNHGKNGRKYCDNCAKQQKTNNRYDYPPPEELYQLAKHIPYTHLAQQYGVSDNAIRKYLKTNGYEPPRRKKK